MRQATRPAIRSDWRERAPAALLIADAETDPPTGIPWRIPEATFAALAALLPVRTRAADLAPIRLETLVSGKSLAFASVEQVGTLGKRFKATALGKMLDDPEMKAFGDPVAARPGGCDDAGTSAHHPHG